MSSSLSYHPLHFWAIMRLESGADLSFVKKVAQQKDHLSPESDFSFLPQNAAISGHIYSLGKKRQALASELLAHMLQ